MVRMILVVLSMFFILSCAQPVAVDPNKGREIVSRIRYQRDPKTGLCFAIILNNTTNGYKVVSIAHVPCDKVSEDLHD